MALISAFTLIRSLSIFHLTLAFYFLTSPATLADQSLVFILGEAMNLPHPHSLTTPSAPSALLAITLSLLALSDLIAVSGMEDMARWYWLNQAPVRLLFFFGLTGWTFAFKPSGKGNGKGMAGEGLRNSFVFTWGFVEMVAWFWIFATLRDERQAAAIRVSERKKRDAEMEDSQYSQYSSQ